VSKNNISCSVDRVSIYNLEMKPNWCTIFSVYFVSFVYNLYMFQTSPVPSSVGIIVFIRHLVFCYSVQLTRGKQMEILSLYYFSWIVSFQITFSVETAFYNGLLKERYKGDRSGRKTRKKTYEAIG
jgi:hypothetical protein